MQRQILKNRINSNISARMAVLTLIVGLFSSVMMSGLIHSKAFAQTETGEPYFTRYLSKVRKGPSSISERVITLNRCVEVRVIREASKGGWVLIERKNGKKLGYIAKRLIEPVDESVLCKSKVKATHIAKKSSFVPKKKNIGSRSKKPLKTISNRHIGIRIDFDRMIGLGSSQVLDFKEGFPKVTYVSGPGHTLHIVEINNSLNRKPIEPVELRDFLIEEHDPRARYHLRVFSSPFGMPFQKPVIHMTGLSGMGLSFQPTVSATSNNTNYLEMLDWTAKAAFTSLEDAIYNDFPLITSPQTIRMLDPQSRPLPDGYQIRVDVSFRPDTWFPVFTGETRRGGLTAGLPNKFINGQLVLETGQPDSESQTVENAQIRLATFTPGDVGNGGGLRFKVPQRHFSPKTFSTEFLGEGSFNDLGRIDVSVIMNTVTGDHIVYRKVLKLDKKQFELPPLLPGNYLIEIIPENSQMRTAIENIREDETPVVFRRESSDVESGNLGENLKYFGDFLEEDNLTQFGIDKIERSAKFLPALLSLTSAVYGKSGETRPLKNHWLEIRKFIFGNKKRPEIMRRLQRTFEQAGLLGEGKPVDTKKFQIAKAVFDKVTLPKRDSLFLRNPDNRSDYRRWILSITGEEGSNKLIHKKFSDYLLSR